MYFGSRGRQTWRLLCIKTHEESLQLRIVDTCALNTKPKGFLGNTRVYMYRQGSYTYEMLIDFERSFMHKRTVPLLRTRDNVLHLIVYLLLLACPYQYRCSSWGRAGTARLVRHPPALSWERSSWWDAGGRGLRGWT